MVEQEHAGTRHLEVGRSSDFEANSGGAESEPTPGSDRAMHGGAAIAAQEQNQQPSRDPGQHGCQGEKRAHEPLEQTHATARFPRSQLWATEWQPVARAALVFMRSSASRPSRPSTSDPELRGSLRCPTQHRVEPGADVKQIPRERARHSSEPEAHCLLPAISISARQPAPLSVGFG